jgi:hypothetical protein
VDVCASVTGTKASTTGTNKTSARVVQIALKLRIRAPFSGLSFVDDLLIHNVGVVRLGVARLRLDGFCEGLRVKRL